MSDKGKGEGGIRSICWCRERLDGITFKFDSTSQALTVASLQLEVVEAVLHVLGLEGVNVGSCSHDTNNLTMCFLVFRSS